MRLGTSPPNDDAERRPPSWLASTVRNATGLAIPKRAWISLMRLCTTVKPSPLAMAGTVMGARSGPGGRGCPPDLGGVSRSDPGDRGCPPDLCGVSRYG